MSSIYTTTLPPHIRPHGPVQTPTASLTINPDADAKKEAAATAAQPSFTPSLSAETILTVASSTPIKAAPVSPIEDHSPPVTIDDSIPAPTKGGDVVSDDPFQSPPFVPPLVAQPVTVSTTPIDISKIDPIDQHGPVVQADDSSNADTEKLAQIAPHSPPVTTQPDSGLTSISTAYTATQVASADPLEADDSPLYDPAITGPASQNPVKSPISQIAPHSPPVQTSGDTAPNDIIKLYDPAITGPSTQTKQLRAYNGISDIVNKLITAASQNYATGHIKPVNIEA